MQFGIQYNYALWNGGHISKKFTVQLIKMMEIKTDNKSLTNPNTKPRTSFLQMNVLWPFKWLVLFSRDELL